MSQATKASILWIGLLQARQFALGEMHILFEYTQMHQDLRAKKTCIHHGEVPVDLLSPASTKRPRDSDEGGSPSKHKKVADNPNTWHTMLKDALVHPMRIAGNPSFTKVVQFCRCEPYKLLPKINQVCAPNLFLGRCFLASKCTKDHRMATGPEAKDILRMLDPFIKDPAKIKAGP